MTLSAMAALFAAMAVLAAVPSVSVLAVSARSATSGFAHGAATAAGIVVADLVFILLAVFGLALLVDAMGEMFFLVKYLGAAYLIWLGIVLWRSRARTQEIGTVETGSRLSSFMAGFLITLADQKAVLFYLGFLPAFVDLGALAPADILTIALIAVLAVGGVKLVYAWAAHRAGSVLGARAGRVLNLTAAGIMIAVGILVIVQG